MKVKIPKDKYFYIKNKEEMVEIMREPVVGALNFTLDLLIDAINRTGADLNEPKETDAKEVNQYRASVGTYQTLLDKIKNNEELTDFDYDLIVLVCKNTSMQMDKQIQGLKLASQELSKISWKIAHMGLNSAKTTEILNGIDKQN